MAVDRRTRLPADLRRDAEDAAANRRISMRIFALPAVIERELEGQFYLGTGADGERRLLEALRALDERGVAL